MKRSSPAFTIVELLIVVVVIAILAAITIVAYNGITKQAQEASLKSEVATALKKVAQYKTENSTYPATVEGAGVTVKSPVTARLVRLPSSACVQYTRSGVSFYALESEGQVKSGTCTGKAQVGTLAGSTAGYADGPVGSALFIDPGVSQSVQTGHCMLPIPLIDVSVRLTRAVTSRQSPEVV